MPLRPLSSIPFPITHLTLSASWPRQAWPIDEPRVSRLPFQRAHLIQILIENWVWLVIIILGQVRISFFLFRTLLIFFSNWERSRPNDNTPPTTLVY